MSGLMDNWDHAPPSGPATAPVTAAGTHEWDALLRSRQRSTKPQPEPPRLRNAMTIEQVADYLGVTVHDVKAAVVSGALAMVVLPTTSYLPDGSQRSGSTTLFEQQAVNEYHRRLKASNAQSK